MSHLRTRVVWSAVAVAAIAVSAVTYYVMTHPVSASLTVASQTSVAAPVEARADVVGSTMQAPSHAAPHLAPSRAQVVETPEPANTHVKSNETIAQAEINPAFATPMPSPATRPLNVAQTSPITPQTQSAEIAALKPALPLRLVDPQPRASTTITATKVSPVLAEAAAPQSASETVTVTGPMVRVITIASADTIGRGNSLTISLPRKSKKQKG
jgi:hypothetical protein